MKKASYFTILTIIFISCGAYDQDLVQHTIEGRRPVIVKTAYERQELRCPLFVDPKKECEHEKDIVLRCQEDFINLLREDDQKEDQETTEAKILFYQDCIQMERAYFQCILDQVSINNKRRRCHENANLN